MRRDRSLRLATSLLLGGAVLSIHTGTAFAAVPPVLYVNNTVTACSDQGSGTQPTPFCTISKAASVVTAGQTVEVSAGTYPERVTITASGTADHPISFHASGGVSLTGPGAGVTISGASYVWLAGFVVNKTSGTAAGIEISGSTHVTLANDTSGYGVSDVPGLRLSGVSDSIVDTGRYSHNTGAGIVLQRGTTRVTVHGVEAWTNGSQAGPARDGIDVLAPGNTVTHSTIMGNSARGIAVGAGGAGTVVAGNFVSGNHSGGIDNLDAAGTALTNNTVAHNCGSGIRVRGTSTGVSVQNNISTENGEQPALATACDLPLEQKVDVGIYDAAVGATTVDYNIAYVMYPGQGYPYAWGTPVTSLADFRYVSAGQGGHDIEADPKLSVATIGATSPAVDSANSAAPGVQPTDAQGTPPADYLAVANTGGGPVTYLDRGWRELYTYPTARLSTTLPAPSTAGWTVTADASHSLPGSFPLSTYRFNFSDGPAVTQSAPVATHVYRHPGVYVVSVTVTDTAGHTALAYGRVTIGAVYQPLEPTRILDTRYGTGTGKAAPLAPGGTIRLKVAGVAGVSLHASAVVLNVTVTQPTSAGFLTVYPDGWTRPLASNLNWTRGKTIANLVTVPLMPSSGAVDIYNSGPGTVQVLADVAGHYEENFTSPDSGGYTPVGPLRVLDTRAATGVPTTMPVAPGGSVTLDLKSVYPFPKAVALNVTITQPTAPGFLTVYPTGTSRPLASNLNWVAGQTIANLATVRTGDGLVTFYNGSSGTVHLVADLAGYYAYDHGGTYASAGPWRALDTRAAIGVPGKTPVPAGGTVTLAVAGLNGVPSTGVTAMVLNVTVTQPTAYGFLTVYPDGMPRPLASNLNWTPGLTIPNLVVVPVVNGMVDFYNGSGGTVHIIADLAGYFA